MQQRRLRGPRVGDGALRLSELPERLGGNSGTPRCVLSALFASATSPSASEVKPAAAPRGVPTRHVQDVSLDVSSTCPGSIVRRQRRASVECVAHLQHAREEERQRLGGVSEVSRRCLGTVSEVCRKVSVGSRSCRRCVGGVSEVCDGDGSAHLKHEREEERQRLRAAQALDRLVDRLDLRLGVLLPLLERELRQEAGEPREGGSRA